MNKASTSTYFKLALIPVLGSVLCYLIFGQRNKQPLDPAPAVVATVDSNRAETKLSMKATDRDAAFRSEWPSFQLADFSNVDPFDRRTLFPEPNLVATVTDPEPSETERLVSTASSLAARRLELLKIQAVFQTPDGVAALVNDRIVRVGDRLEDGSEVIEISTDHLSIAVPNIH
jgi:hypothetical protein